MKNRFMVFCCGFCGDLCHARSKGILGDNRVNLHVNSANPKNLTKRTSFLDTVQKINRRRRLKNMDSSGKAAHKMMAEAPGILFLTVEACSEGKEAEFHCFISATSQNSGDSSSVKFWSCLLVETRVSSVTPD